MRSIQHSFQPAARPVNFGRALTGEEKNQLQLRLQALQVDPQKLDLSLVHALDLNSLKAWAVFLLSGKRLKQEALKILNGVANKPSTDLQPLGAKITTYATPLSAKAHLDRENRRKFWESQAAKAQSEEETGPGLVHFLISPTQVITLMGPRRLLPHEKYMQARTLKKFAPELQEVPTGFDFP